MTLPKGLQDLLSQTQKRRERDAKRFEEHDKDLCMLCHAYGADKRSLFISCFYEVSEVIPEAIDLYLCEGDIANKGFYLRICKTCRGALLALLARWRDERIALRETPKDHDGYPLDWPDEANISIRVCGTTVMMTQDQYASYKAKAGEI